MSGADPRPPPSGLDQRGCRRRSRRWHIASNTALALAAVVSVATTIAVVVLRVGVAPVLSDSMSPAFEAGAVVITMPRAAHDLEVGDIVILPLPDGSGARFAHRVVERSVRGGNIAVRTKGDANPTVDEWHLEITSASVPVVVASIPHLGWTSNVVRSTGLRLALAGVVAMAALVGIVRAVRTVR